jgi:2-octaprenyl-6-methoxyphenol hydroxylase
MVKYDIVIIGGGLMARSLTKACQGLSLKIAVIEARQLSPSGVRQFALNPVSKQFFTSLGCWPQTAIPIQRIHISQQGRFGKARLAAGDLGVEALGYCVPEPELMAMLSDGVDAEADWYCPATCTELVYKDGHYTVTLADKQQLQATLLVAADGSQSMVRRTLKIPTQHHDYQQTALIANLRAQRHHDFTAYERFTAHGPIALLPAEQSWVNCVYSVPSATADAAIAWTDAEFIAHVQADFGYRLGRFEAVTPRVSFPLSLITAENVSPPQCVLIGNAAQTLHPAGGQGLNLGIRDVAILADVLAQAVRTKQSLAAPSLTTEYQNWRDQHRERIIALTDRLAELFIPQNPGFSLLRGLGLHALGLFPPLTQKLTRLTMGYTDKMPSSLCGIRNETWKT